MILQHRFRLVRPMLNSPYHGFFLPKFLPIRESRIEAWSDFQKEGLGEGIVAVPERRIAMTKNTLAVSSKGHVLIEFLEHFPQISIN